MRDALLARFHRLGAVQEVMLVWGLSFSAIVIAFILFRGYAKLVATVTFLYLPLLAMSRRGEDYQDYGVTLRHWRKDLKLFLLLVAMIVVYLAAIIGDRRRRS